MKERGIIMSAPMILALLDGRKTQTRRIVKPHPPLETTALVNFADNEWACVGNNGPNRTCRYGVPGDRLWVRETWRHRVTKHENLIQFRADCGFKEIPDTQPESLADETDDDSCWRPSIHMPRWASRITLEITGVRVERLQEINEEDAKAEGVSLWDTSVWLGEEEDGRITSYDPDKCHPGRPHFNITKRTAYASLWDSLHGEGSWRANPWVWALSFRRVT